jgi:hypothetical protein
LPSIDGAPAQCANTKADANLKHGVTHARSCQRDYHEHEKTQREAERGELTPVRCEYVGADEVSVSMRTRTGDITTFSLKTALLVHLVNLSVALINNCGAEVFGGLDVF